MSDTVRVLAAFILRYRRNAKLMVREVFGVTPDPWQDEVLDAYSRGERGISIASCHGPGKTAVAAWCAIHHMLCFNPQKTAVTAPTSQQAFDSFFAEVKLWMKKLRPELQELFEPKADSIVLRASPEASFVTVRTARKEQPEALQGIHSDHVLLIADEASGIPEEVYEAASGSMSGHNAITLLISNPTRTSGLFFDTHHALKGRWWTRQVGWQDSPRVDPKFEEEMRERYGADSNAYRVRVLGLFPKEDEDVLIPFDLVDSAMRRDVRMLPGVSVLWGLDVAWTGSGRSALCKRAGLVVPEPVKVWHGVDPMALVGQVVTLYRDTPPTERPVEILVDVVGLGAGVHTRLRELGLPSRGINVAESPAVSSGKYKDGRSEYWFKAREWLASKLVKLPDDPVLIRELCTPTYKPTSTGKMWVETKNEMRARGKPSPDVADAFVLTFASEGVVMVGGQRVDWNQPLRRNLKGIV